MDDSPFGNVKSVAAATRRQPVVAPGVPNEFVIFWVRQRAKYIGVQIRSVDKKTIVFKADLHPPVSSCRKTGGVRAGNKLPAEDRDVLKEELASRSSHVATAKPSSSCTLSTAEQLLGSADAWAWGEGAADCHFLEVFHGGLSSDDSTATPSHFQSQVLEVHDNRGELEKILFDLEASCKWNSEALQHLMLLKSRLSTTCFGIQIQRSNFIIYLFE